MNVLCKDGIWSRDQEWLFGLIEEFARRDLPFSETFSKIHMSRKIAWLELLESYQTRLRRIHLNGRCVSALIEGATRVGASQG